MRRETWQIVLTLLLISTLSLSSRVQAFSTKHYTIEGKENVVSGTGIMQDTSGLEEIRCHLMPWADQFLDVMDEQNCSDDLVIGLDNAMPDAYHELAFLIAENEGRIINTVSIRGKVIAVVASLPHHVTSATAAEIESRQLSRFIESNVRFQTNFVPNDPYWEKQWGSLKIEADWAWNTTIGDPSVLVAVVDTGINYNHEDLEDNYVPFGHDWVNDDPNPLDDHGHGTHCAGIIAASTNNGVGIAGTAQVKIMAEKGLNAKGVGYSDWLANCIIHAVDQGANVISMSWGSLMRSELIHKSIKYAYNAGVLLVAAAGNDAWSLRHYPAAYDEVVAIAATDQFDEPASFTNYGDWVELAAPGVEIVSTYKTPRYRNMSGTSMSTPYVSGVAALIWSRFPTITRDQLRIQLRRTSNDLGDLGRDEFFGYGRVNARNSVEQDIPDHDVLILDWNITQCIKPGDSMRVNSTILNFGKNNESNVEVQLLVDGDVKESFLITFLPSGASAEISLSWKFMMEGIHNVTLCLVPVPYETILENNVLSASTLVRLERVIRVPDDFSTIKQAIDAANSGFIIYVSTGEYRENLVVYKPLTLIGEHPNTTFIDGNGKYALIAFHTVNFRVSGFTIQNSRRGIFLYGLNSSIVNNNRVLDNDFGIMLKLSSNNTLRNNDMRGNVLNFGVVSNSLPGFINDVDSSNTINGKKIYYWINQKNKQVPKDAGFVAIINSTNVTVKDLNLTNNNHGVLFAYTNNSIAYNVSASNNHVGVESWCSDNNSLSSINILDNDYGIGFWCSDNNSLSSINISGSINGFESWYSDNNILSKINTLDNWFGIVFWYCNGNTLSDSVSDCIFGGIILLYSNRNIISTTLVSNNLAGVAIGPGSCSNSVHDNMIADNIYGLEIDSTNNTIRHNSILSNYVGMSLSYSSNNTVFENTIQDNFCGLKCLHDRNFLYHNNFINNGIQVESYLSENVWDNGYPSGGNYWSDYTGVDSYSGTHQNESYYDYIGDTQYNIDENSQDSYPLMSPWTLLKGDINNDQKVDIYDIVIAATSYSSKPGHPNWNPFADIAPPWRSIDIYDLVTIAYHYGETYP